MSCRYCNQPLSEADAVPTHAYWNATPDVCHKECKQAGEKQEAYDCQLIDAGCNDCAFLKRGKRLYQGVFATWTGTCLKTGDPVTPSPKTATGKPCFVHRRDHQAV